MLGVDHTRRLAYGGRGPGGGGRAPLWAVATTRRFFLFWLGVREGTALRAPSRGGRKKRKERNTNGLAGAAD